MPLLLYYGSHQVGIDLCKCTSGHVSMKKVKVGVARQSTFKIRLRLGEIAQAIVNHASMEEEFGILCPLL
jgi:hypothetical protein